MHDLDDWSIVPLKNFTLKDCLFGAHNIGKNKDKSNMCIAAVEQHLMNVSGILTRTLLETLSFLVLIIVHHFILKITRIIFSVR